MTYCRKERLTGILIKMIIAGIRVIISVFFAGALRAVDFIASLPEYDGKNMGVTGSSQGGALSVVTAALDKRITFYAAIHPAMCDHQAHLKKTAGGWPHYFYYFPQPSKERITTAAYYDVANFAHAYYCTGVGSVGDIMTKYVRLPLCMQLTILLQLKRSCILI